MYTELLSFFGLYGTFDFCDGYSCISFFDEFGYIMQAEGHSRTFMIKLIAEIRWIRYVRCASNVTYKFLLYAHSHNAPTATSEVTKALATFSALLSIVSREYQRNEITKCRYKAQTAAVIVCQKTSTII